MIHASLSAQPKLSISLLIALALGAAPTATASGGLRTNPIVTRQVPELGSRIAWGEAEAELGQPVESVLPVLADYAGYETFMPNFRRSRVLAQRGTRARVYMEVSAAAGALTLWGQLELRERAEAGGSARVIEATLLEGNIEAFRAAWRLEPTEDGARTHVAFRIFVDPDLPLPSSLISRENERAARRSIEALCARLGGELP